MPQDDFSELSALFSRAAAADDQPASAADAPAIAARRRKKRRSRLTGTIVTVVILAAIGAYIPLTLAAGAPAGSIVMKTPTIAQPAAAAIALPQGGESAVTVAGADEFLGATGDGLLASSGGNGALPMASVSKLITALVVLDAKPLNVGESGPSIAFSNDDVALYEKYYALQATVAHMKFGAVMSEQDALKVMLLVSACNYAEAVSTWAFGSQAKFVSTANAWLKTHGLTGTKLVEPTGVDERNVSTPTDLIAIGKLALANPMVASIVDMPSASVSDLGTIDNTNGLLGVDGINGIKTGTLEDAHSNLLFSAAADVGTGTPLSVVGVVLGGGSREGVSASVKALLASIRSGFHNTTMLKKGAEVGTYTTPWNSNAKIVAGVDASVLTWSNTPITSVVTTAKLKTGTTGAAAGSITYTAGKRTVAVPLVLDRPIKGPDAWWRLTHPGDLFGK